MTRVVGIVPAAGRGTRFGGGKLIALVEGRPMIERTLQSLFDAGLESVTVILAEPSEVSPATAPILNDPRVTCAVNLSPGRGMFSTVQAGLEVAPAGDVVVVLPGDMPFVNPGTTSRVAQAAATSGRVVVARYRGRRGHPVAFPARLRLAILASPAESNLSETLKGFDPGEMEIEVDDPGIIRDVDRPADL